MPLPAVVVAAWLEAYYQGHVQDPSNRLSNLRGFDNHDRSLTLANVAVDVKGERGPITAHVVLQSGPTLSTYLQAANLTAQAPRGVVIEAGLFPSPIGLEVIPAKDNWNFSRSELFVGLPLYHTGAAVAHALGRGWT